MRSSYVKITDSRQHLTDRERPAQVGARSRFKKVFQTCKRTLL